MLEKLTNRKNTYNDFDQKWNNTEENQFFKSNIKNVFVVITYKDWNKNSIPLDDAEDWELFVITKESFKMLYGPTLNGLAQFFYNYKV